MELIGAAAAEVGAAASPVVRSHLQRMADLGNVPRNEKKFKNFVGNSLRVRASVHFWVGSVGVGARRVERAGGSPLME